MPVSSKKAKEVAKALKKRDPDYFHRIGKIGGMNGTGHDFGHGKVDPSTAGAKGGAKSRRGPSSPEARRRQSESMKRMWAARKAREAMETTPEPVEQPNWIAKVLKRRG